MYYRNAQAALVVYDLTKASSLVKARHWVAELQRQASPGIVIALVGNKSDLVEGESDNALAEGAGEEGGEGGDGEEGERHRKVSTKEAKDFAEEEGLLFFETSAKTGGNVTEVFTAIAESIPETALKGRGGAQGAGNRQGGAGGEAAGRVDLGRQEGQGAKEGCAC